MFVECVNMLLFVISLCFIVPNTATNDSCWIQYDSIRFSTCLCEKKNSSLDLELFCDISMSFGNSSTYIHDNVTSIVFRGGNSLIVLENVRNVLTNVTKLDVQDNEVDYTISYLLIRKVSNLQLLRLHNCRIITIHPRTFRDLRYLKVLDLSGNSFLTIDSVTGSFEDLNSPYLETLNISGIHNAEDMATATMQYPFFERLSNTHIEVFDASWIRLTLITDNFNFLPNLKVVNFTGTSIYGTVECVSTLLALDSLEIFVLDLWPTLPRGYKSIVNIGESIHLFRRSEQRCITEIIINPVTGCWSLMPNLKTLQFRFTDLNSLYLDFTTETFCIEENQLLNFMLTGSKVSSQIGSFRGFQNLKYFDMAYPASTYDGPVIKPDGFHEMPALEVLIVPGFRFHMLSSGEMSLLVSNNIHLRIVDMSNNGLKMIPEGTFLNNIFLENLNLSRNLLTEIRLDLSKTSHLNVLDLSYNRLKTISKQTVDMFRTRSGNGSLTILLNDNIFLCDCNVITLSTLRNIHASIQCELNGHMYQLRNHTMENLPEELVDICDPPETGITTTIILAITAASVFVVLTIVIILLCIFRRRRSSRDQNNFTLITLPTGTRPKQRNPKFIVFLAYCYKDYEFAVEKLYPKLDQKLRTLLKNHQKDNLIIVNDKNFLPGREIDDLIATAIQECYVTVAVISEAFLESNWCQFEILKSFNENVPLIPLYISKCEPSKLRGVLRELYNTRVRILWPSNKQKNNDERTKLEDGTIDLLSKSIVAHVNQCKQDIKNTKL